MDVYYHGKRFSGEVAGVTGNVPGQQSESLAEGVGR